MPTQRPTLYLAVLLCVFTLALAACGDDAPPPPDQTQATDTGKPRPPAPGKGPAAQLPDFTGLVKHVAPSVVNISAVPPEDQQPGASDGDSPIQEWLRKFFDRAPGDDGPMPPMPHGPGSSPHPSLGSGFIISKDGYILTNRHVIEDAGKAGQIIVKLNDRRQLLAQVVGQDEYSDLAVLKVDAEGLPTVKIGDSDKLAVGSWVVAIGSPFGFETSVTAGIVSAKQRSLASDQYVPFLQTDVAINPGNSGGPLFNLAGEVVGINSQIYSQTGGYQGVSFAIPINVAMNVSHQLRDNGSVTRGWLGVQIQDVDRELAKSFELKRPEGALVARVMPDSPAAAAELRPGDVILGFNGHEVDSAAALPPLVGTVAPGKQATVTVLRDGERQKIKVQIKALPKDVLAQGGPTAPRSNKGENSRYGMTLESLSTGERHELELDQGGVKVTGVTGDPAAGAGLQPGDVILAVGSKPVEDAGTLRHALSEADGPVALLVLRDGTRLYLAMRASETADSGAS